MSLIKMNLCNVQENFITTHNYGERNPLLEDNDLNSIFQKIRN
jgi:hypothetical protein